MTLAVAATVVPNVPSIAQAGVFGRKR